MAKPRCMSEIDIVTVIGTPPPPAKSQPAEHQPLAPMPFTPRSCIKNSTTCLETKTFMASNRKMKLEEIYSDNDASDLFGLDLIWGSDPLPPNSI
jgi:hypothetical protein